MDHQEFFGQGIGLKGYFASIQDRWEGWGTRTKVTGCSTVQDRVLHSNGVSCCTPGRTMIYKHWYPLAAISHTRTPVREHHFQLILDSSEHHFDILGTHFDGHGHPEAAEKARSLILSDFRNLGSLGMGIGFDTFANINTKNVQKYRKRWPPKKCN